MDDGSVVATSVGNPDGPLDRLAPAAVVAAIC